MRGPTFTMRTFGFMDARGRANGDADGDGKTPSVDELCDSVARLTSDDQSDERLAAVDALVRSGAVDAPVKVVDRLMTRPGGSAPTDREVLRRLAEATADGMERTASHLVSILGTGANDSRAITMLTWLAPEGVETVIGALSDPAKQQLAIVALGYIRDARAVDALRPLMLESADPQARRAAGWALGKIGDPGAGRALLAAAASAEPAEEAPPSAAGHAAAFAPASLRSLDFDGLAELYEIAVDAWRAADRSGDDEQIERWSAMAEAVVEEARRRPAGGGTEQDDGQRRIVSRRRDRRRARLLAACGVHAPGA